MRCLAAKTLCNARCAGATLSPVPAIGRKMMMEQCIAKIAGLNGIVAAAVISCFNKIKKQKGRALGGSAFSLLMRKPGIILQSFQSLQSQGYGLP